MRKLSVMLVSVVIGGFGLFGFAAPASAANCGDLEPVCYLVCKTVPKGWACLR